MHRIWALVGVVGLFLAAGVYFRPYIAMIPFNLWVSTIEDRFPPIFSRKEMLRVFPKAAELELFYPAIRDECLALLNNSISKPVTGSEYLGFSSEFFDGWTTVNLRFLGVENPKVAHLCPITAHILDDKEEVPTVMISRMAPSKHLRKHRGPFKGILRVHLGLDIPDGDCFIEVGDELYHWRNGEVVMFDETYPHSVQNNTSDFRTVLYLDVKRPMGWPTCWLRDLILLAAKVSPHIRNDV